jgi:hypothetical protein
VHSKERGAGGGGIKRWGTVVHMKTGNVMSKYKSTWETDQTSDSVWHATTSINHLIPDLSFFLDTIQRGAFSRCGHLSFFFAALLAGCRPGTPPLSPPPPRHLSAQHSGLSLQIQRRMKGMNLEYDSTTALPTSNQVREGAICCGGVGSFLRRGTVGDDTLFCRGRT